MSRALPWIFAVVIAAGIGWALFGAPGLAAGLLALLPAGKAKLQAAKREQAQAQTDVSNRLREKVKAEMRAIDVVTERDVAGYVERYKERTGQPPTDEEIDRWRRRFGGGR